MLKFTAITKKKTKKSYSFATPGALYLYMDRRPDEAKDIRAVENPDLHGISVNYS